jgi:serine protease
MAGNDTERWGRRTFLKATGVVGLAAATSNVVQATPGREPGPKRDELLVGVSLGIEMDEAVARLDDLVQGSQRVAHRNDELRYVAVQDPSVAAISAAGSLAGDLRSLEFAKFVEENEVNSRPDAVDDPKLDSQYAPQLVNAVDAWETTQGSEDVTIAVVDQGVDYTHPDLEAQFGSNKGRDFVDDDGDPIPDDDANEYHGTHVAGIASATTDNGVGVAGVSDSRLLSGRALSEEGQGSTSDIADAVQWAADRGADIVNMSLGGGGYTDTMKNAMQYALNNGSLPICAAGNDGSGSVSYPAAYDECVAVGAVDSNENLTDFSQYGPNLDVVAPGQNVLSTSTRSGGYEELPGTSMACPAASGVAALGLAAQGDLAPEELRTQLKSTAVDVGLSADRQGSGRVDALNIVGGDGGGGGDDGGDGGGGTEPPVASIDVSPTTPDTGETVTFDGSGSSDPDGGGIESYEWEASTGGTATGTQVEGSWDQAQDVTITLTVTDDDGETGTESVVVSIGGTANEGPTADLRASATEATVGEGIDFDASGSSDLDGSIAAYDWSFGDGTSASGATVSKVFDAAGDYTVALTVTDDDGATDSATLSVSIQEDTGGGGSCGDSSDGGSAQSSLSGWWDSESFTYTGRLSDPCQLTVTLDGPAAADFDLFLTADGRTPSPDDYDKRSITQDSQERIIVEDVAPGQEFGVTVDAYSGSGSYTVTVEELGA